MQKSTSVQSYYTYIIFGLTLIGSNETYDQDLILGVVNTMLRLIRILI